MSCPSQDAEEEVVGGYDGLMQVYLPVHKSTGDDEFLDGIDAFLVDYQRVVFDIEHVDDAFGAYYAFADTGKEGVTAKVVEAVHVELG